MLQQIAIWLQFILNHCSPALQNFVTPALQITSILKRLIANPKLDYLAELTATKWDDIFLEKIRTALDTALIDLGFIREAQESREELIALFLIWINDKPEHAQHALLSKIASRVAFHLSDATLQEHECDFLCQTAYSKSK